MRRCSPCSWRRPPRATRLPTSCLGMLVKMVPYLANMPKQDVGMTQIDTLVINRYTIDSSPLVSTQVDDINRYELMQGHKDAIAEPIDAELAPEGTPPEVNTP